MAMPANPHLKLILMRHAESWGNRLGQMEGQQSTALTRHGCDQALQLRQVLHRLDAQMSYPTESVPICYTSPLLRALQTAAILCAPSVEQSALPMTVDTNLQEIHPGIFQGLTWAAAVARYPELCQRLCSQLDLVSIPEAESPVAARRRAAIWLTDCLGRHGPGETVWVVTHAGLLQHLVAEVLGCDRTWQMHISHTSRFEFWLANPGAPLGEHLNPERWQIRRFNQLP